MMGPVRPVIFVLSHVSTVLQIHCKVLAFLVGEEEDIIPYNLCTTANTSISVILHTFISFV
jgi:hypothetical protein